MRPTGRRLAIVATLIVVITAGCAGNGGLPGGGDGDGANLAASGGGGDAPEARAETAMDVEGEARTVTAAGDGGAPAVRERARIRTGQLTVEVGDFDAARRNLSRTVRRQGGFVSDSRERLRQVDGANYTLGSVVLRVPRKNFSATMSEARAVGTVLDASRNSRDVTDQLVDINARLRNLRAQRDRLRGLYRNASNTDAILDVEERLSEVQTEIERLEAQKTSLQRQVALSTITVELREPRPEPEPIEREQWYDTGVAAAFLESVDGVVVVVRALVVGGAFALPYLLAFGVPLAAAVGILRRRRDGGDPGDDSGREGDSGDDPGREGGSAGETGTGAAGTERDQENPE